MKLTDQQIRELQSKFLSKKVSIPFTKEMYTGFGCKSEYIIGICKFIGYNEHFPNWGLQLTLDRMPVQNVDYKKIKLYE